ncbi:uncharacterized protein EHS24_009246 [Apiotrichum porosum]|uniref:Major facilitator superfamily (MFS) profile domain-containing protein n=1 Tax=Apiotrichum porosum TaxID=105984 RepID=A0A427XL56_9TREE|nr:uncharacterized protein EHS24_009246 [Apiotrichum porosum]RSH79596.1 hypothetical protein EHS24_009246 [Apiotrichum porosum]
MDNTKSALIGVSSTDMSTRDPNVVVDNRDLESTATDPPPLASAFVNLNKWQATRTFWRATLCCFFAGFCVLMEGYQASLSGSVVSNSGFIHQFGTVISADGKKSLDARYVSAWGGTGIILEMFVSNMPGWLGAKIVTGMASGMGQATSLLYLSEVAPSQTRGALMCCYALFLALGQLSASVALLIVKDTVPEQWRRAIYSQWVLVSLFLVCLPFLAESPWYYARKGQDDRAKGALKRLYGMIKGYDIEHEYAVMKAELDHEQAMRRDLHDSTFKEIWMGTNLWRTLPSFFGVIMVQWSGATLLVFMVGVSFYSTERFGRRTLVFVGGIGCFVCNIVLGTLGVVKRTDVVLNVTLAVICIWVLFYAGCLGGVCWGLTSEISTPRLRARTTGIVVNMSTCFSLLFGYTVPLMLAAKGSGARNWGVKTMYLFACLGGIGLVVNYFLLPEVRGRTFAEVDEMFEVGVPPRKTKSYVTRAQRSGQKH